MATAFELHFIIGALGAALTVAYMILNRVVKSRSTTLRASSTTTILLAITIPIYIIGGLAVFAPLLHLNSLNAGEAAHFLYTWSQKDIFLRSFYGLSLYALLPVGLVASLFGKPKIRIFGLLTLGIFSLSLSAIPYALKFYTIGRFFTIALMAFGFWTIVERIQTKSLRIACIALLTATSMVTFIQNTNQWKQPVIVNGVASHVSNDERATAAFIKNNYANTNSMIISDPATQYILEATTGVNSQGGAYATKQTRDIMSTILTASSYKEVIDTASNISDLLSTKKPSSILITIGARTLAWNNESTEKKNSIAFNEWSPVKFTLNNLVWLSAFENRTGLIPMYANDSIRVYRVEVRS